MASTLKCPFCGGTLLSNEKNCPHCGGENSNYVEDTARRVFHPKTIEEMKEYCAERGMPLLRMRFFVGQDFREPKAFGIYKAGENRYVVYKNKADGSRAVRYDGPDEAHAVNELFEKLLSECHNRGIYPDGAVPRASSGSSASAKASNQTSKVALLTIVGVFLFIISIPFFQNWAEQSKKINALRQEPYTYDCVSIGNRYYTFDLGSQKVVSSSDYNNHLNDGYYIKITNKDVPVFTVYYRDGKKTGYRPYSTTWYIFSESAYDWKPTNEPAYSQLGKTLEYAGTTWQSSWNVPDFSLFPMEAGYYSHGEDYYYKDTYQYYGTWYIFLKADQDWAESACPVKLGIPAESLEFLGNYEFERKNIIRRFSDSTPYAIKNKSDGYYRLGGQVYYRDKGERKDYISGPFNRKTASYVITKYDDWYTYGQEPDPDIPAEQASGEWYKTTAPDEDSLVYLGYNYEPGWLEQWSVPDFKKSAVGMQVYQINGYLKQEKTLFYHYKRSWYRFDTDSNTWWKSSSEPAGDGLSEIFLGDSYQGSSEASVADEWNDDWVTTDFKTSAAWYSIERAEAAEAERVAREMEANQRDSERDSYSSDYDSWDIGDTDWDSDW